MRYRIAADVELMMRLLEVAGLKSAYIPHVLVRMRLGGVTNRNLGNVIRQNIEILRALNEHQLRPALTKFVGGKLIDRARQFLLRPAPDSDDGPCSNDDDLCSR